MKKVAVFVDVNLYAWNLVIKYGGDSILPVAESPDPMEKNYDAVFNHIYLRGAVHLCLGAG